MASLLLVFPKSEVNGNSSSLEHKWENICRNWKIRLPGWTSIVKSGVRPTRYPTQEMEYLTGTKPCKMQKIKVATMRPIIWVSISAQISLCWSESLLIAYAFYGLHAIQRGMNKNPCHIGWMYRLIWVFADHIGLIVVFVICWLI